MNTSKLRALASVGAVVVSASVLGSSDAQAIPREGAPAANARAEDVDGRVMELKSFKGKPILILYEDKESARQNVALKEDLAKLAKGDRYKSSIALAAIADVSAYDFWPAKGFVKDAIREESKKQKTTIYCDWNGSFRTALHLRRGVSNVVLVARDGKVLFAAEGTLSADQRKKLIGLIREQIEGT